MSRVQYGQGGVWAVDYMEIPAQGLLFSVALLCPVYKAQMS